MAAVAGTGGSDGAGAGALAESPQIVQLEEAVVNRIAAGEVVVRPANALKEMMENSIDAGSGSIVVAAKGGGLKMLRIEDDGHGIRSADLPILCERFTTSKLKKYDDLNSISTFGFRGEALASISHVAHVTVTTMTAQDNMARVAQYSEGKLRAPPRPCAGTRGTTVLVEDLFYNNPTRRQALGKESLEHARILEVIQKYAIHYPKVSFTCRKATANISELHTAGGNASSMDAVGVIYGQSLAKELFSFEAKSEDPPFSCRGLATSPQWTARSCSMTLFINNRLVECSPLRRAVEAVYAPVLPRHQHPWVYLALDLDPVSVDVNVHPTKMEVQFLHEEQIAAKLQDVLQTQLRERGGMRTFGMQSSLASTLGATLSAPAAAAPAGLTAGAPPLSADDGGSGGGRGQPLLMDLASEGAASDNVVVMEYVPETGATGEDMAVVAADTGASSTPVKPSTRAGDGPKKVELNPTRVRTDHRQRSLESVFRASQNSVAQQQLSEQSTQPQASQGLPLVAPQAMDVDEGAEALAKGSASPAPPAQAHSADRLAAFEEAQSLTSLAELRERAATLGDAKLSAALHQSVWVGAVTRELVLLQCGTALCLVNLAEVATECAYQRMLRQLGGPGAVALKPPLPLKALLKVGILDDRSGYDPVKHASVDVGGLVDQFAELLTEKAELLREYFMLDITDSKVTSLPNALGLASDTGLKFDGLPLFLVRLCSEINWEEEKACLDGLCRTSARFLVEALLPSEEEAAALDAQANSSSTSTAEELNAAVAAGEFEDVAAAAAAAARKRQRTVGPRALQELKWLHEAVRGDGSSCKWPARLARDGTFTELVSLEQLYRIFERC